MSDDVDHTLRKALAEDPRAQSRAFIADAMREVEFARDTNDDHAERQVHATLAVAYATMALAVQGHMK